MFYFCYMKNKTVEINNLLYKISREDFSGYEIVDYWDADTTAIGLQKENILIYVSTFNFPKTNNYDLIIEDLKTGKILKSETIKTYAEFINGVQVFLK